VVSLVLVAAAIGAGAPAADAATACRGVFACSGTIATGLSAHAESVYQLDASGTSGSGAFGLPFDVHVTVRQSADPYRVRGANRVHLPGGGRWPGQAAMRLAFETGQRVPSVIRWHATATGTVGGHPFSCSADAERRHEWTGSLRVERRAPHGWDLALDVVQNVLPDAAWAGCDGEDEDSANARDVLDVAAAADRALERQDDAGLPFLVGAGATFGVSDARLRRPGGWSATAHGSLPGAESDCRTLSDAYTTLDTCTQSLEVNATVGMRRLPECGAVLMHDHPRNPELTHITFAYPSRAFAGPACRRAHGA
jgi:hypothetical protein